MNRLRYLHRFEDFVLVFLVVCLLLLTCGQILLRNLFSITFLGTENLVRHLVLWIGLAGALLATRLDKHIRVDALLRLLPIRIRGIALGFANFFTAVICGYLSSIASIFILDEREFGTMAFFAVPAWIAQICFPLVFGLMALRFLFQCWIHIYQPTKRPPQ